MDAEVSDWENAAAQAARLETEALEADAENKLAAAVAAHAVSSLELQTRIQMLEQREADLAAQLRAADQSNVRLVTRLVEVESRLDAAQTSVQSRDVRGEQLAQTVVSLEEANAQLRGRLAAAQAAAERHGIVLSPSGKFSELARVDDAARSVHAAAQSGYAVAAHAAALADLRGRLAAARRQLEQARTDAERREFAVAQLQAADRHRSDELHDYMSLCEARVSAQRSQIVASEQRVSDLETASQLAFDTARRWRALCLSQVLPGSAAAGLGENADQLWAQARETDHAVLSWLRGAAVTPLDAFEPLLESLPAARQILDDGTFSETSSLASFHTALTEPAFAEVLSADLDLSDIAVSVSIDPVRSSNVSTQAEPVKLPKGTSVNAESQAKPQAFEVGTQSHVQAALVNFGSQSLIQAALADAWSQSNDHVETLDAGTQSHAKATADAGSQAYPKLSDGWSQFDNPVKPIDAGTQSSTRAAVVDAGSQSGGRGETMDAGSQMDAGQPAVDAAVQHSAAPKMIETDTQTGGKPVDAAVQSVSLKSDSATTTAGLQQSAQFSSVAVQCSDDVNDREELPSPRKSALPDGHQELPDLLENVAAAPSLKFADATVQAFRANLTDGWSQSAPPIVADSATQSEELQPSASQATSESTGQTEDIERLTRQRDALVAEVARLEQLAAEAAVNTNRAASSEATVSRREFEVLLGQFSAQQYKLEKATRLLESVKPPPANASVGTLAPDNPTTTANAATETLPDVVTARSESPNQRSIQTATDTQQTQPAATETDPSTDKTYQLASALERRNQDFAVLQTQMFRAQERLLAMQALKEAENDDLRQNLAAHESAAARGQLAQERALQQVSVTSRALVDNLRLQNAKLWQRLSVEHRQLDLMQKHAQKLERQLQALDADRSALRRQAAHRLQLGEVREASVHSDDHALRSTLDVVRARLQIEQIALGKLAAVLPEHEKLHGYDSIRALETQLRRVLQSFSQVCALILERQLVPAPSARSLRRSIETLPMISGEMWVRGRLPERERQRARIDSTMRFAVRLYSLVKELKRPPLIAPRLVVAQQTRAVQTRAVSREVLPAKPVIAERPKMRDAFTFPTVESALETAAPLRHAEVQTTLWATDVAARPVVQSVGVQTFSEKPVEAPKLVVKPEMRHAESQVGPGGDDWVSGLVPVYSPENAQSRIAEAQPPVLLSELAPTHAQKATANVAVDERPIPFTDVFGSSPFVQQLPPSSFSNGTHQRHEPDAQVVALASAELKVHVALNASQVASTQSQEVPVGTACVQTSPVSAQETGTQTEQPDQTILPLPTARRLIQKARTLAHSNAQLRGVARSSQFGLQDAPFNSSIAAVPTPEAPTAVILKLVADAESLTDGPSAAESSAECSTAFTQTPCPVPFSGLAAFQGSRPDASATFSEFAGTNAATSGEADPAASGGQLQPITGKLCEPERSRASASTSPLPVLLTDSAQQTDLAQFPANEPLKVPLEAQPGLAGRQTPTASTGTQYWMETTEIIGTPQWSRTEKSVQAQSAAASASESTQCLIETAERSTTPPPLVTKLQSLEKSIQVQSVVATGGTQCWIGTTNAATSVEPQPLPVVPAGTLKDAETLAVDESAAESSQLKDKLAKVEQWRAVVQKEVDEMESNLERLLENCQTHFQDKHALRRQLRKVQRRAEHNERELLDTAMQLNEARDLAMQYRRQLDEMVLLAMPLGETAHSAALEPARMEELSATGGSEVNESVSNADASLLEYDVLESIRSQAQQSLEATAEVIGRIMGDDSLGNGLGETFGAVIVNEDEDDLERVADEMIGDVALMQIRTLSEASLERTRALLVSCDVDFTAT